MELRQESSFEARRDSGALVRRLLAFDTNEQPHVEDAFLADFARFARDADPGAGAWCAIEVGRAALDLIDDLDGPWQALPIEPWLDALVGILAPNDKQQMRLLARSFLEWLVMRGRLSLHGQRLLARRIAAWRW